MSFRNVLLSRLPADELRSIVPKLSSFPLKLNNLIADKGSRTDAVFFVEEGLLSLISEYGLGREVEIGIVGREGFADTGLIMGDNFAVHRINVQVAGSAWRMALADFTALTSPPTPFRQLCLSFARSLEIQMASTASANGRAKLEERLSRWLLMVQDRLDSSTFNITHDFLAQMLCCRRPGVTVAMHLLEGYGYVRSGRGIVTILDREGLTRQANGGYGQAEMHYGRLIGEDFRARWLSQDTLIKMTRPRSTAKD